MVDRMSAKEILKLKRPSLITNSNTSYGVASFSYPNNVGRKPKRAIVGRRMFFSFICFDKKDVRIKNHRSHIRIEHHQAEETTAKDLEESGNSIQVYATTIKAKGKTGCQNMERKLEAILPWDAIPKPYEDDDVASDASSDLFEIESITMSQKHYY